MLENSVTGNATSTAAAAAFNRTADPSASVSNPLYSNVTASFKYWVDGPIGMSVACLGVMVNLVAIVVLARQRVQRTFHLLMIFLSVWDFMWLIFFVLLFSMSEISQFWRDRVYFYLVPYLLPLLQICLSGSCYSTVALTVERYIAVCAPFFRLRHNIKARFYILPILLFAPLYNMPRFFEFGTELICFCKTEDSPRVFVLSSKGNSSKENFSCPPVNYTEALSENCWVEPGLDIRPLRHDDYYIAIYVNYVNLLMNLIVPTLVLAILNCFIYRALRNNGLNNLQAKGSNAGQTNGQGSNRTTEQLRRNAGPGSGGAEALRKRDVRLTRIAIVIVGVFITCHLPRFIPNIAELFTKDGGPEWFAIIISCNNFLQIINCTVNYIIYFGHCWRKGRPTRSGGMDKSTTPNPKVVSTVSQHNMVEMAIHVDQQRALLCGPNTSFSTASCQLSASSPRNSGHHNHHHHNHHHSQQDSSPRSTLELRGAIISGNGDVTKRNLLAINGKSGRKAFSAIEKYA